MTKRRSITTALVAAVAVFAAVSLGSGASAHAEPEHAHEAVAEHEGGEHGSVHEHDEKAPPEDINWIYGLISEKKGAEPSLWFRPVGMPPPFLATLINFGILIFLAVRYGRKPVAEGLAKRKDTILRDIEEAQRLRSAAETRLREYEAKLAHIHEELERVSKDFRDQGERERDRIVREAGERRERMKKDAEFLLSQELKQMKTDLLREAVDEATRRAQELLTQRLTQADHDRFAEQFITDLRPAKGAGASTPPYGAVAKGTPS